MVLSLTKQGTRPHGMLLIKNRDNFTFPFNFTVFTKAHNSDLKAGLLTSGLSHILTLLAIFITRCNFIQSSWHVHIQTVWMTMWVWFSFWRLGSKEASSLLEGRRKLCPYSSHPA